MNKIVKKWKIKTQMQNLALGHTLKRTKENLYKVEQRKQRTGEVSVKF